MITEATVKLVKYPPELIPDSWFGDVPLNAEVSPPILELIRFKPYIVRITNIQLAANASVILRLFYDDVRLEENTAAMLSGLVGAWKAIAKERTRLNFLGLALVPDYTTHFGLWCFPPTIAHKLLYGITLTNSERAICEELGIRNTVEKGILPLPISQQIEREYHVLGEETRSRSINIAAANTSYDIESIYPKTNEFIVLTRLAAAPGTTPADNIRLIIDRDDDTSYAELKTYALSLTAGGEVECFIPAMKEIRLHTIATGAPGAHLFRYTFQRIKLTNLLRVRFSLVSEDEVPAELWKKVKGGIL
ncbi:hypothetical protein ES703_23368 [subsurface metagenome]